MIDQLHPQEFTLSHPQERVSHPQERVSHPQERGAMQELPHPQQFVSENPFPPHAHNRIKMMIQELLLDDPKMDLLLPHPQSESQHELSPNK